jgi:hypothetical protein
VLAHALATPSVSAKEVAVKTAADDTGRANTGLLVIILVIIAILLGLVVGVVSCTDIFEALRTTESRPAATGAPSTTTTGTTPAPECVDDTAAFRTFAGPQSGPRGAALASVTRVCWEPTGALRVESRLSIDVNASSTPMTVLCRKLSDYISQAGRPWRGFTVYSKHPAFDGQPLLSGRTPGGACTKPQH